MNILRPCASLRRAAQAMVLATVLLFGGWGWPQVAGADFGGEVIHITVVVVGAKASTTSIDVSLACNPPLLFPPPQMRFWSPGDQDINAQGMSSCSLVVPPPTGSIGLSIGCAVNGNAQCTSDRTVNGGSGFTVTFTVTATFPAQPLPTTSPPPLPPAVTPPPIPDGAPTPPLTVDGGPNPTNPPPPAAQPGPGPSSPSPSAGSTPTTPASIIDIGPAPAGSSVNNTGLPASAPRRPGDGAAPNETAAPVASSGSGSSWPWLLFGLLVLLAAGAAASVLMRRPDTSEPTAADVSDPAPTSDPAGS